MTYRHEKAAYDGMLLRSYAAFRIKNTRYAGVFLYEKYLCFADDLK